MGDRVASRFVTLQRFSTNTLAGIGHFGFGGLPWLADYVPNRYCE
jgi:hypothetical protein